MPEAASERPVVVESGGGCGPTNPFTSDTQLEAPPRGLRAHRKASIVKQGACSACADELGEKGEVAPARTREAGFVNGMALGVSCLGAPPLAPPPLSPRAPPLTASVPPVMCPVTTDSSRR